MGVGEALAAGAGLACLVGGLRLARSGLAALSPLPSPARGPGRPVPGVPLLEAGARKPLLGLALGLGGTFLLQSSSAFVVLLAAAVDAGLIGLREAVPVVLGANLGSTLVSQMLALLAGRPWQAPAGKALVLAGFVLAVAGASSRRGKRVAAAGRMAGGTGLLLLGLDVLGAALAPLGQREWFAAAMEALGRTPAGGLLAGTALTVVVLSSTVTVAVLQELVVAGHLGLAGALPVLLGADVGTTSDVVLASLACGRAGRSLAAVHLLANALTGVVLLPLTGSLAGLVAALSAHPPAQVAHAHVLFNVFTCAVGLPLRAQLARLGEAMVCRLERAGR